MKSKLLLVVTGVFLLSVIACNKEEVPSDLSSLSSGNSPPSIEQTLVAPPIGNPEAVQLIASYDENEGSNEEAKVYCVYELLSVDGPRQGGLSSGDLICIKCPDKPVCPGNHYLTMYEIFDPLGLACFGDMMLHNAPPANDCIPCEKGHKGYEFL